MLDTIIVRPAALAASLTLAASAAAQGPPAAPVRYTEAREHQLRPLVRLSGAVEAVRTSVIASDVAGVVETLPVLAGDAVAKGDVLATVRQTPLKLERQSLQAQLDEARVRLEQAERRVERAQELYRGEVATASQFDDTRYERAVWRSRAASLEAELARVVDRLQRSQVRAPFAGVVTRRFTEVGMWLTSGGSVVELLATDQLEIRIDVPERYYPSLRVGQPASIRIASLPAEDVAGTVRAVVPAADPRARTFPVYVQLPSRDGVIGVGMLAVVGLGLGEPRPAVVVPKDAVVDRGPQRFVFTIGGDDMAQQVAVDTGGAVGDWIEVDAPIEPGTKVITRGTERLFPGQAVRGEALTYDLDGAP